MNVGSISYFDLSPCFVAPSLLSHCKMPSKAHAPAKSTAKAKAVTESSGGRLVPEEVLRRFDLRMANAKDHKHRNFREARALEHPKLQEIMVSREVHNYYFFTEEGLKKRRESPYFMDQTKFTLHSRIPERLTKYMEQSVKAKLVADGEIESMHTVGMRYLDKKARYDEIPELLEYTIVDCTGSVANVRPQIDAGQRRTATKCFLVITKYFVISVDGSRIKVKVTCSRPGVSLISCLFIANTLKHMVEGGKHVGGWG